MAPSAHEYFIASRHWNSTEDIRQAAYNWAVNSLSHDVEPIYTLRHLCELTDIPYPLARAWVSRRKIPYRTIEKRKSNGEIRYLRAPLDGILKMQQWILKQCLQSLPIHRAAFAYLPNRSAKTCSAKHIGARWIVKLDIADFYNNISERMVFDIFLALGYSRLVSFELARLCTYVEGSNYSGKFNPANGDDEYVIADYADKRVGYLPQGAATSGALANAAFYGADQEFSALAAKFGMVYTRYSDDITLSTSQRDFNRKTAGTIIAKSRKLCQKHGFILNKTKTKVVPPGARKIVLGLVLGESGVYLQKYYKQLIDQDLRKLESVMIAENIHRRHFDDEFMFLANLRGRISYAHHIEPKWAVSRWTKLNRVELKFL